MFLVDASGTTVNSSRQYPAARLSVADREYFKTLAKGKDTDLFVDKPTRSRLDGEWTLHVARRISTPEGGLRGVLVARINLEYLEHLYGFMKLDFDRPISLYTAAGQPDHRPAATRRQRSGTLRRSSETGRGRSATAR